MTLGERIAAVRKNITPKMSQEAFAQSLGKTRAAYAMYEIDRVIPDDSFIQLLCDKYKVNQKWLRTGEGDMFRTLSREDELMVLFADLLKDEPGFKHRLISALLRMEPSEWAVLEKLALDAVEEMKKADPQ